MNNPFARLFLVQPSNAGIQEAAARHMIASHKGPKPVTRTEAMENGYEAQVARAAAARAAIAPEVLRLLGEGMTCNAIADRIGRTRDFVKRVVREAKA